MTTIMKKRTGAAQERINVELEEMLSAHRVVRATLPFGLDILEVVAPLDIPEIGVLVGQTFWLAGSSFDGYCYPVTAEDYSLKCGCKHHEFYRSCKHTRKISAQQLAAYRQHQKLHDASIISEQVMQESASETQVHIVDEYPGYAFDAKPAQVAYCDGCGRLSKNAMCAWCLGAA